jgi:Uncharacterized protein conserved in bacteria
LPNKQVISFPHLGDYYIPINYLLKNTLNSKVLTSPTITKKTIELGSKHSPDFVCIPFKYNLGNYIESLENGANLLMQAGGGCRFGCYPEVQKKILEDLGYKFDFINLTKNGEFEFFNLYKIFKELNPKLTIFKFTHVLILTFIMINYMDKIDDYIRQNIGFEVNKDEFTNLKKQMLAEYTNTHSLTKLTHLYFKYKKKFKRIPVNKHEKRLKIGIIGELYTSMEPFSSYFLEQELASMNIEVKRFTNATYLIFKKRFEKKKMLNYAKKYIKYQIGADGLDNVYRTLKLIDEGYDGIIHIKPFGCTPEVGAIPIIDKICKEKKMPVIYFSFDNQTSIEGIKTRLEAFYDMLNMKKEDKIE